ncbi:MAG TPA: hypothetical protein VHD36_01065 [Pirellulales bacterium]|nr:hypothetical protein [Pirellulales bacterium]
MSAAPRSPLRALIPWLIAYVVVVATVLAALRYGREMVITRMGDPESVAAWQRWAEETRRPVAPGEPVERRPVKSDEPPALVLMRDHFGSVQAVSLVIGTFLFCFLGFLGHGIWSQGRSGADPAKPTGRD